MCQPRSDGLRRTALQCRLAGNPGGTSGGGSVRVLRHQGCEGTFGGMRVCIVRVCTNVLPMWLPMPAIAPAVVCDAEAVIRPKPCRQQQVVSGPMQCADQHAKQCANNLYVYLVCTAALCRRTKPRLFPTVDCWSVSARSWGISSRRQVGVCNISNTALEASLPSVPATASAQEQQSAEHVMQNDVLCCAVTCCWWRCTGAWPPVYLSFRVKKSRKREIKKAQATNATPGFQIM
jgi:hypothetical protein